MFLWIIQLKNVFVVHNGISSGIDIVQYSRNQPLQLCWIQMQISGTYTMIQLAGLKLKLWAKCQSFYFCYKTYIPRVLLVNLFKQTHSSDTFA
jgi:hypothetical protein